MTRLAAGLLASACAVATLAAAPPQDPATQAYRSATNLVSVYTTVTDENGRLVTDLRRDEFEVRDNGRVQPLTVFSNDLQPFTAVVMLDCSGSMADHFEHRPRTARSRSCARCCPRTASASAPSAIRSSIRPDDVHGRSRRARPRC